MASMVVEREEVGVMLSFCVLPLPRLRLEAAWRGAKNMVDLALSNTRGLLSRYCCCATYFVIGELEGIKTQQQHVRPLLA